MKKSYLLLLLLSVIFASDSFGQQAPPGNVSIEEPNTVPLNPNGDSELALLMRAMFDDGMEMKLAIANGAAPKSHIEISKLYTSEPSVPGKADTPEYEAFAKAYEAAFNDLGDSKGEKKTQAYQTLVNSCIACHKSVCPGPIVRIEKMKL